MIDPDASTEPTRTEDTAPIDEYGQWGGSQYESEDEHQEFLPVPPSEGEGSEIARAMAMRTQDSDEEDEIVLHLRAGRVTSQPAKAYQFSSSVRRKDSTPDSMQPRRDKGLQATLCALININGLLAYTLFDSGSTTDSITPEFSRASQAKLVKLDEQVVLQLGCAGSRSKINYGTWAPVRLGSINEEVYFDIVNLDRYDCVIGTPFMNKHGIVLDFDRRAIVVKGQEIPAFTTAEDTNYRARRRETKSPGAYSRTSRD